MNINRGNNALYGAAFEQAIVNIINYCTSHENGPTFFGAAMFADDIEQWACECSSIEANAPLGYPVDLIVPADRNEIYSHAAIAADKLYTSGMDMNYGATRIGSATKNEDGDIRLHGGTVLEVKYVSRGIGTYNNMSVNTVARALGLAPYTGAGSFLYGNGWIDTLANIMGEEALSQFPLSPGNDSPMGTAESSQFRKAYPGKYRKIATTERELRKQYVNSFFLSLDETSKRVLLDKLLNKDFSGKARPSYFVVFRRATGCCEVIDFSQALGLMVSNYEEDELLDDAGIAAQADSEEQHVQDDEDRAITMNLRGGYSIVFPGILRMTFAWQNGTGLCNPTVRTFLLL